MNQQSYIMPENVQEAIDKLCANPERIDPALASLINMTLSLDTLMKELDMPQDSRRQAITKACKRLKQAKEYSIDTKQE